MTTLRIAGIDPGIGGAVALLAGDGVEAHDMPVVEIRGRRHVCPAGVRRLLDDLRPDIVVLEHVQGVQGTGATSAFSFGRSFGVTEGVVAGMQLRLVLVRPQVWTAALRASRDKGSHRSEAARLWPRHAELFARVRDDGRADAALMAHWLCVTNAWRQPAEQAGCQAR